MAIVSPTPVSLPKYGVEGVEHQNRIISAFVGDHAKLLARIPGLEVRHCTLILGAVWNAVKVKKYYIEGKLGSKYVMIKSLGDEGFIVEVGYEKYNVSEENVVNFLEHYDRHGSVSVSMLGKSLYCFPCI